jgi:hypothetical protein
VKARWSGPTGTYETEEAQPAVPPAGAWPASSATGGPRPCPPPPRPSRTGLRPNADGWREILPRQEPRPVVASTEPRRGPMQLSHIRKIPTELHDRCFNCLSYSHRVATCRLPRRCLRCHDFSHLARDYKRPRRSARSMAKGGDLPRHSARGNTTSASPCGDPSCSDGAAQGAAGGAGGI